MQVTLISTISDFKSSDNYTKILYIVTAEDV